MRFILSVCRDHPELQIMYGIGGEKELTESTLDHLGGYGGVAAGADRQRRLRPAPERRLGRPARLDLPARKSAARERHPGRPRADPRPGRGGDRRLARARPGDLGVARGPPALRLLEADDLGRGRPRRATGPRASAGKRSPSEWEADGGAASSEEILERGCRDGVFRQHYDTDALDASTAADPALRFLPPDDPRVRATVDAIAEQLTEHGLVLRYRVEETDDGLCGEEGTFLICSFWLVSALSEIGEPERARELCERLLEASGSLDLYAEELEAESGRHLGNFPQAFTHLALINAVSHVIADEQREDGGTTAVFTEMGGVREGA